jgi:hypothetical protein
MRGGGERAAPARPDGWLSELVLGTIDRLLTECARAAREGDGRRLRAVRFSIPYQPAPGSTAPAVPEAMSLEEARRYFRHNDVRVRWGWRALAGAPPERLARLELTVRL